VLEALRSADGDWHTAKEIKMLAGIGHTRATEVCGELVERGELLYAVGPPGRHPSSRCWALREREPDMGEPGSPLFEG
jgi:hypothetical protein